MKDMFRRDVERVLGGPVDGRIAELTGAGLLLDGGSWLLGQIPVVGVILSDLWADNIWADRIAPRLSAREREEFTQADRILFPETASLLAAIRRSRE